MEFLSWTLKSCLWLCIHVVLLSWSASSAITLGNDTDRLALLAFKGGITQDPRGILSSWNDSIHFCEWVGVICSVSNQRVVVLSLESQELVGSISPSVGNLSFLTGINLRTNNFNRKIPDEIGRLSHLQYLNLSFNSFQGEIPLNLTKCLDLRVLDVVSNDLTEYGMGGEVSVLGDVYSYGILLLETFTGRRPTDAMFEGFSLYDFVLKSFPNRILDIADPFLISKEQGDEDSINDCETLLVLDKDNSHSSNMKRTEECLISVIRVGLSCCAPSPKERMHMKDVVTKMNAIRDSLIGSLGKSKRNLQSWV